MNAFEIFSNICMFFFGIGLLSLVVSAGLADRKSSSSDKRISKQKIADLTQELELKSKQLEEAKQTAKEWERRCHLAENKITQFEQIHHNPQVDLTLKLEERRIQLEEINKKSQEWEHRYHLAENKIIQLDQANRNLRTETNNLFDRMFKAERRAEQTENEYNARFSRIQREVLGSLLGPPRLSRQKAHDFIEGYCSQRGLKALSEGMTFCDLTQIECSVSSPSGNRYKTSLTYCSCPDFQTRHRVCKHMLGLAIYFNTFTLPDEYVPEFHQKKLAELQKTEDQLKKSREEKEQLTHKLKALQEACKKAEGELANIIQSADPCHEFAVMYADMQTYYYEMCAHALVAKKRPAPKEAMKIQELRVHTAEHIAWRQELTYKYKRAQKIYPSLDQILNGEFDEENPPVLEPLPPQARKPEKSGKKTRSIR